MQGTDNDNGETADAIELTKIVPPYLTTDWPFYDHVLNVQRWIDEIGFADDDLIFISDAQNCSLASTIMLPSDSEVQNAAHDATVILADTDSDMQDTVHTVNRIQDRTEAILNGRPFYAAIEAAFDDHVFAEITRILDLPEDGIYMSPSNGLLEDELRWLVTKMREKVKQSLQRRYGDGGVACDGK